MVAEQYCRFTHGTKQINTKYNEACSRCIIIQLALNSLDMLQLVSHIRNTAGSEIPSVWSAHAQRDPLMWSPLGKEYCGRIRGVAAGKSSHMYIKGPLYLYISINPGYVHRQNGREKVMFALLLQFNLNFL